MLKIDNITIAYKDVPTVVDFSLDMAGGSDRQSGRERAEAARLL